MTVLRKMFVFKTKHRIVSYWRPNTNRFVSSHISCGEEDTENFGKHYDDVKTNVSNNKLELQNTARQYVAHNHRKRKFTNNFGGGPGLKDFINASEVQPVKCETVPYVRNASINGLNRKGNSNYQVKVKVTLRPTISQSVCLGVWPNLDHCPEFAFSLKFLLDSYRFVIL
jgi:hypothetical protein